MGQRLGAVRVLGLIPDDPHAAELAEKALKDPSSLVRVVAATSFGQMHASGAGTSLKQAVNDKNLSVAMAAEHALYLLNDPAYYELYYEVYTGERKNDSGLIAQEMKVIHDPKQLAHIGLNEGMGFVPFSGIGWEALRTIMKDRKGGCVSESHSHIVSRDGSRYPHEWSSTKCSRKPELGSADGRFRGDRAARRPKPSFGS